MVLFWLFIVVEVLREMLVLLDDRAPTMFAGNLPANYIVTVLLNYREMQLENWIVIKNIPLMNGRWSIWKAFQKSQFIICTHGEGSTLSDIRRYSFSKQLQTEIITDPTRNINAVLTI